MKTIELTARPLKGHKTSANLKIEIDKICEQWNISPDNVNAVVTDGGGNIKGAVKEAFGTSKHISCFGHMLNLMGTKAIGLYKKNIIPSEMAAGDVPPQLPEQESDIEDDEEVTVEVEARGRQAAPGAPANVDSGELLSDLLKKVKKIVTFFRQSEVATSELKKNQMDAGKKENEVLKLIQECRTRWNSAYEMVERFLKLSDYVTLTLMKVHREKSTKATPPSMLSNEEIGYLAEVRDLLRPLYQATVEASADKHVTISKVIPLVNLMREKIYEFIPESGIAFNLRTQLLEDIKTNFGTLEFGKIFSVATLIDPRFKALPFKNKDALKNATNHLASLMRAKMAAPDFEEPAEEQPLPPPATQAEEDDLWSSLDRNVQAHRAARQSQPAPAVVPPPPNRIPEELQRYLDMPNCNRKKFPNPIEYLETIKDKFPYIYEVAREVLPIVATSTPCERLFSHAGLIFTQLRNRLHGSKVDELVFLRSVDEEMWFSVQVP
ncbi:hypothetical protein FOCC_FOCC017044 [Frankliniella occidentalis]|uniref:E3 SUMO-protein ligase ZBED1-like n=1 Tax=Frankliniella occidentalis TaxID=133901 RepID=A0A9C6XUY2_FRAOC|nr:E3 SUMO-protein ligase ZBED1-like [Frankliniella occidentalis]KAE8737491.1 hypothetical protein FOCC_FOCC017044 [Frankliniella occidentalis]